MSKKGAISERQKAIFSYKDAFNLSTDDMIQIINTFHREIKRGLQGKRSSLAMLPTFVGIPTGKEKGTFLALDLGGSTFRVLLVYLPGNYRKPKVIIEKYTLKASEQERKIGRDYDYTQGSWNQLFGAIAHYIRIFLQKHKRCIARYGYKKPYSLGFTFSFPVKQKAIDQAILNKLTKEFKIPDLINQDVVYCLSKALNNEGLDDVIKVVSLNNDTVGTLIARSYQDRNCDIGGIVGTGTNFCYLESVENIHTLTEKQKKNFAREGMIINIESGNFNKITQNPFDIILDNNSIKKGEHIQEKMVSGLYLEELTRIVLLDLIKKGLLFKEALKEKISLLTQKGSFKAHWITKITEDNSPILKQVHALLAQWGIQSKNINLEDRKTVQDVCLVITRRSARITAAVIFAILTHIDKQVKRHHTVAMDGSLYEKDPIFRENLERAITELSLAIFNQDYSDRISCQLCHDGSGIGAAIIAAGAKPKKCRKPR